MEQKQVEDSIDVGKLREIALSNKKQLVGVVTGCMAVSLLLTVVLPKTYESTTLVQVRNTNGANSALNSMISSAAALGISTGFSKSSLPNSYIELMKSRNVLEPIIDNLEWEDEKEKPEAVDFAKKRLSFKNTESTDLITVTAKGKSPEEAQMISQAVVDNFLTLQTGMNQQTQSLLVKFWDDQIKDAKKEAEDARTKFAEYQREHKVYSPDEQAKAAVNKMNAFDDTLGELQVQEKALQAKLTSVNGTLGDMAERSRQYNVNDNTVVQGMRGKIVEAQIELVSMRERYTEDHPSVISAQKKLQELNSRLQQEVGTLVASKYSSLNPAQAALLQEQAAAQAGIAVAQASELAVKARREEKEKELDEFPKDVLEYLNLQRDVALKEGLYTNLVKQLEQNKLQKAMESMDIQVVDPANLPRDDKPSFPKLSMMLALGVLTGIAGACARLLWLYKKVTN